MIHQLPLITIQHDLPQVVEDIKNGSVSAEDVWISCYTNSSTKSAHGKVRITVNDLTPDGHHQLPFLEPRDGIQCRWADHCSYEQLALIVSCEALSIPETLVSFPHRTMKGIQPKGIECMNVAGEWVVTGGKNGNLRLDSWKKSLDSSSDDDHYRIGRGHLSDITSCQFFPSGEVILTTSIDMSARIYSIHGDPVKTTVPSLMLNPRTLAAPHGRSIPAAAIIGRGKEIITGCKDGKIRIWNVSESKVMAEQTVLANDSADILCMKIAPKRFLNRLGELAPPPVNEEIHEDKNFLAIGLSSGALEFLHVPSLKPVKYTPSNNFSTGSAIDVLAISETGEMIAYATRSGRVTISTLDWQLTSSEEGASSTQVLSLQPFTSWTRTEAGVNALEFSKDGNLLLVAGNDGLPYLVKINSRPAVLQEFAGFDCEPVQSISVEPLSNTTFLAGKDGSILVYK